MRLGIIDIGSNTVRLAVYDTEEIKVIQNGVNYAGLIAYVKDGSISDEGINILCSAIEEMTKTCRDCVCEKILAFATASLRDITDKAALIELVRNRTGIQMEIVSGEREAELDYLGLCLEFDVKDGAVFDLGGGSAQLIAFENSKVTAHISRKIGALRIYKDFVSDIFPSEAEEKKIRKYVKSQLADFPADTYEFVFAMGGAASALKKLYKFVFGEECDEFSVSDLKSFYDLPENVVKAVIPERIYTIKPALIAIEEIMNIFKTDKIKVVSCGVREGILNEFLKYDR